MAGVVRGKAMPLSKFEKLDNVYAFVVFYQTISGDYVDLPIADQWTENDMVLTLISLRRYLHLGRMTGCSTNM